MVKSLKVRIDVSEFPRHLGNLFNTSVCEMSHYCLLTEIGMAVFP